jgi:hypothetical protein
MFSPMERLKNPVFNSDMSIFNDLKAKPVATDLLDCSTTVCVSRRDFRKEQSCADTTAKVASPTERLTDSSTNGDMKMRSKQEIKLVVSEQANDSKAMCGSRHDFQGEQRGADTTAKVVSPTERLNKNNLGDHSMNTPSKTNVSRPDSTWTLNRLQDYAISKAIEIHNFGRRTITESWLFGESLALIRKIKKEDRTWMEWLKTQPFSPTTATNAIKLHERVGFEDLESFDGMNISDMKVMLSIIKRPPPKRRETPTPTSPALVLGQTNSATAKKYDKKVAPMSPLKVFPGDSQVEEQTATNAAHADELQNSAAVETPATEPEAAPTTSSADSQTPTATISPTDAMTCLHRINVKLEELERDLKGVKPDDHLLRQIDIALGTLTRLRSAVAA